MSTRGLSMSSVLGGSGLVVLLIQLFLAATNSSEFGREPGDDFTGAVALVLFWWLAVSIVLAAIAAHAAWTGRFALLRSKGVGEFLLVLVLLSIGHVAWPMFLGSGLVVLAAVAGNTRVGQRARQR